MMELATQLKLQNASDSSATLKAIANLLGPFTVVIYYSFQVCIANASYRRAFYL